MAQSVQAVPLNLPSRRRLLMLLSLGGLLIGICWLLVRENTRGVSYYFPTWNANRASSEGRAGELTDIHQSLPIVLDALEQKLSGFGLWWEALRGKFPSEIQEKLPEYTGPNELAVDWMVQHAHASEVARAFTNRWPTLGSPTRERWLTSLGPALVTNRPEYRPIFRSYCQHTNPSIAGGAVWLLASYQPIPVADVSLIINWLTNSPLPASPWVSYRIVLLLGSLDPPPPELRKAFETCLASPDAVMVACGALGLGKMDPAVYPPARVLEPAWRKLSVPAGRNLLTSLRERDRALLASDWGIGFLKSLLMVSTNAQPVGLFGNSPPKDTILASLNSLGETAQPALPAIVSLLDDPRMRRDAAKAFVNLAGDRAEYVPLMLQSLTNVETSARLLLWLTSMGPRAKLAEESVRLLATNGVRFSRDQLSPFGLDPILARRYGLITPVTSGSPPWAKRGQPLSPEAVKVDALYECPKTIIQFWPGYEAAVAGWPGERDALPMSRLPKSNLAELARRCLVAMTNGVAPTPPP